MKQKYIPQPIDTSDVILPDKLKALAEDLAKNVHEVWAKSRMEQGWTYGEERNDKKKRHSCLIPYDELPEEEKDYDRNTSQETLKSIVKLGYSIM
ncbi:MAG: RyR domain-containing protein [Bacteroidales bacterium]|nr:RyR domain-containing protein [Bacteroidales bacterium]